MRLIWLLLIVLAVVACLMDLKCEFCRQSCKTEAALKLHRRKYCSGRQQIVGGGIQKARDDAVRAIAVQRQHDKAHDCTGLSRSVQQQQKGNGRSVSEGNRKSASVRRERMNAEYSFFQKTRLSLSVVPGERAGLLRYSRLLAYLATWTCQPCRQIAFPDEDRTNGGTRRRAEPSALNCAFVLRIPSVSRCPHRSPITTSPTTNETLSIWSHLHRNARRTLLAR
ncbi:hypothetical protein A0H81_08192 [Grifola frondosa]|uniref:C2H2-type domain-containing protein n=1 Tax=Grifola frondosa TaxID=5627 RepID=A0A1C7M4S9_GRIFR|nr:hypothetical protein A0H81_08192 [Grifola frondosa]